MNKLINILPFILLLQFSLQCIGQDVNLPLKPTQQEYYFNEVKLSGNSPIRDIRAMVQDNRGFIWMAGIHGLLRFDGHDFKSFQYNPGDSNCIVDNEIYTLYLHADTLLCIGGMNGVSLLDVRTEKITNLKFDQDNKSVRNINEFFIDSDGTIWIAALNGLYSLKKDFSGIINHHLNIPPIKRGNPAYKKRAYCIQQHPHNKNILFVGTEYGLVSFDIKKNALHKTYPNTKTPFWRSADGVFKFIKEGNYLWTICWISGIPRFDMVTEQWTNFAYPKPNDRLETTDNVWAVNDFLMKNENEIWICDWDRGLYIFDKNKEKLEPAKGARNIPPLTNFKLEIFMLADSTIWLSNADGLWKQNRYNRRFRVLDVPFSHQWISSYLHDESTGNYYFGMSWQSYGIPCWNPNTSKWTFLQPEINQQEMFGAFDMFKDRNGVIWVGTGGRGLWYIDEENKKIKPFIPPDKNNNSKWEGTTIYRIFEDSRNNLWIGTRGHGVIKLNPKRDNATYYSNIPSDTNSLVEGANFRSIEEDQYGRIWIGSRAGFCTYDPITEKFSQKHPKCFTKQGFKKAIPILLSKTIQMLYGLL